MHLVLIAQPLHHLDQIPREGMLVVGHVVPEQLEFVNLLTPRGAIKRLAVNEIDLGATDGNIRVAWLFDPELVEVLAVRRLGEQHPAFSGDETRGWEGGRKCLAIEARFSERDFVLVNCHLKSKRGDDRLFGSNQPPRFGSEEQRSAQVRVVLDFLAERLASDAQANVIILGDMNEHQFSPPMRLLADHQLVNLMERVPPSARYSFNFIGNSQLLDHILVSRSLAGRVSEVTIAHLNTDRADAQRASDHDPVIVRLLFD